MLENIPVNQEEPLNNESEKESLIQREETIVLPFSVEEFKLLQLAVEKFQEKTETDPEVFNKLREFVLKLKEKYGDDFSGCALVHVIDGSGLEKLAETKVDRFDFDGDDSIFEFINKL